MSVGVVVVRGEGWNYAHMVIFVPISLDASMPASLAAIGLKRWSSRNLKLD